jgi:PAS domain-containing protein
VRDVWEDFLGQIEGGGDMPEVIRNFPLKLKKKSGDTLDVLMTKILVRDEAGNLAGAHVVAVDVTEEKRATEALRVSEERFRKLYTQTPVMMCALDDDGRIKDISNHWCRALGYKREEVLGRPGDDFFTEDTVRCIEDYRSCSPSVLKSAKARWTWS